MRALAECACLISINPAIYQELKAANPGRRGKEHSREINKFATSHNGKFFVNYSLKLKRYVTSYNPQFAVSQYKDFIRSALDKYGDKMPDAMV